MIIGPKKYLFGIVIPSVLTNVINSGVYYLSGKTKILINESTYYSLPFERSADFFGNTKSCKSMYIAHSLEIALLYLGLLMLV